MASFEIISKKIMFLVVPRLSNHPVELTCVKSGIVGGEAIGVSGAETLGPGEFSSKCNRLSLSMARCVEYEGRNQ